MKQFWISLIAMTLWSSSVWAETNVNVYPAQQMLDEQDQLNLYSGIQAYYDGDYAQALQLLKPLADKNDPRAQVRVARMLLEARATSRDKPEAIRMFSAALAPVQLAASQGHAWAQSDLADYYFDGLVIDQDRRTAAVWYQRAAEQGYAPAQTNLGWLYFNGYDGVAPNRAVAIHWFNEAAAQGNQAAAKNLRALGESVPQYDKRDIKAEVAERVGTKSEWIVSVGAIQNETNLKMLQTRLADNNMIARPEEILIGEKPGWRLVLGPFATEEEASRESGRAVLITGEPTLVLELNTKSDEIVETTDLENQFWISEKGGDGPELPECPVGISFIHCLGTVDRGDGYGYVGEFKNSVYHGQGTLTWPDGKYVGEFKDGEVNGQGTFTYADGRKYVGESKEYLYHGQGTYTLADGRKYVGEFKDGKQHGRGTYTFSDGGTYVGEWKDGKRYGQGTETWSTGKKYVGEFKDDKYHGQGTGTFANGNKYVGEFKDGKYHGQGTFTWPDGGKYVGEFKEDKPWLGIDYLVSGKVQATYSNGNRCEECAPTHEQLAIVEKIDPKKEAQSSVVETDPNRDLELEFWKSIKDSDDPDMFQAYIDTYPNGNFLKLVEVKLEKLTPDERNQLTVPDLEFGKYYALVIGNNRYPNFQNLRTPINDARVVSGILRTDYDFDVQLLEDATESEILGAIVNLRSRVGRNDNVLIYYGGHGELDRDTDEGFWIPSDAKQDDLSTYVPVDRIRKQIKAMPAKHVMVVADSCFAGSLTRSTLTRALKVEPRSPEYRSELERVINKKSRTALTSGGLEPVLDSGDNGHSVFANAFISALKNNRGVLDAHELFIQVRSKVRNNSPQNPEYSPIYGTNHDHGDFLFVKR